MTQPDLVSKLREVITKWPNDAALPSQAHWGDSKWQAKREIESLLGLEGQAADIPQKLIEQALRAAPTLEADLRAGKLHSFEEVFADDWPGGNEPFPNEAERELIAAEPPCGPSQPEPLEFHKPGQIPVNTPICDKCGKMFLECQCSQPAPSTPIVPGTAGLSAEQIASAIAANKLLPDPPGGFDMEGIAKDLNTLLGAERPAPAGEVPRYEVTYYPTPAAARNARLLQLKRQEGEVKKERE